MELSQIQIEQQVSLTSQGRAPESFVEPHPDNEVQAKLRGILDYWGPNGERHLAGNMENIGRDGDKLCVYFAYWVGCGYQDWNEVAYPFIRDASGGGSYHRVSESSFENARAMVERAIILAGQ